MCACVCARVCVHVPVRVNACVCACMCLCAWYVCVTIDWNSEIILLCRTSGGLFVVS